MTSLFRALVGRLALPMAAVLLLASAGLGGARAGIVASDAVAAADGAAADRARLVALVEREDVRDRMIALGVAPEEAASRVAALSDAEVEELVDRIDVLPAGEGPGVLLIGVLLGVILVLLLL